MLIAAAIASTAVIYPHLSAQIPIHWNAHLQPDGSMPRACTYLFGPGVMAVVALLTRLLPWISPKDFQVEGFRSTYRPLMRAFFLIVICIYAATLWAGLGHPAFAGRAIALAYCLGFIYFGNALGKVRRNFFIGVITPWTLTNERVWYTTHRFAGKVWLTAGFLGLILAAFGFNVSVAVVLLIGYYGPKLYSLVIYKQLELRGEIECGLTREQGEQ
ncbi:MAG: SdpI family protein [Terracidiphilus sp.]